MSLRNRMSTWRKAEKSTHDVCRCLRLIPMFTHERFSHKDLTQASASPSQDDQKSAGLSLQLLAHMLPREESLTLLMVRNRILS